MKKIGNPELFDNDSECPETSWGQKFRNTRLVFRKKDGKLEFHTYGGDHRPHVFNHRMVWGILQRRFKYFS